MNKSKPPEGTIVCTPITRPNAYALLIHDLGEIASPSVSLIAQALSQIGIQTLVCGLHHMQQPVTQQSIQDCYDWLSKHFYNPQLAIGIGLGAHMQHLIDWHGCMAVVHVDAPGENQFASAASHDLFASPNVDTPSGVIQIHPDTASSIVEPAQRETGKLAAIPQLWLGKPALLTSIKPDFEISCIYIETTLYQSEQKKNANLMATARLISAWILTKIAPSSDSDEQSNDRYKRVLQAEGYLFDSEQIEMRAGEDISFALPTSPETSERILLLAMAHATLVQLRDIIKQSCWNMPRIHVDVHSAKLQPASNPDGENPDQAISFIREIHILEGMDEVRKNLLHHQLPNAVELAGLRIDLVNRLR